MSKRITRPLEDIIEQCSKWYHDSTQWFDDSWETNKTCWDFIKEEMNLIDSNYEKLEQANLILREALESIKEEQCAGNVCTQMWYQDLAEDALSKADAVMRGEK